MPLLAYGVCARLRALRVWACAYTLPLSRSLALSLSLSSLSLSLSLSLPPSFYSFDLCLSLSLSCARSLSLSLVPAVSLTCSLPPPLSFGLYVYVFLLLMRVDLHLQRGHPRTTQHTAPHRCIHAPCYCTVPRESPDNSLRLYSLCFNQLETLASSGASDSSDRTLACLTTEIDKALRSATTKILLLATTSSLEAIDDAILRPGRLDQHFEIALPDTDARCDILNKQLEAMPAAAHLARSNEVSAP